MQPRFSSMMVPHVPVIVPDEETALAGLVVEVELDVFRAIVKAVDKPLILVRHTGLPKTYRYFIRFGGYHYLYRSRTQEDFASTATVIPVKAFFSSPANVT